MHTWARGCIFKKIKLIFKRLWLWLWLLVYKSQNTPDSMCSLWIKVQKVSFSCLSFGHLLKISIVNGLRTIQEMSFQEKTRPPRRNIAWLNKLKCTQIMCFCFCFFLWVYVSKPGDLSSTTNMPVKYLRLRCKDRSRVTEQATINKLLSDLSFLQQLSPADSHSFRLQLGKGNTGTLSTLLSGRFLSDLPFSRLLSF